MPKLLSITKIKPEPVYDITVSNRHTFLIGENNIITHNSMFAKTMMGGGCVVADTEIQTPNGLKKIQDFKIGDEVITKQGIQKVSHTWTPNTLENGNPICYEIEFDDGYKVTCSENHKFIVNNEWVEAKDLNVNDECETTTSLIKIKSIKCIGTKPVYDLTIDNQDYDSQNYVLENGVISHNTGTQYSPNTVLFITKAQEKDGKELQGFRFTLSTNKSRTVRENSKFPLLVTFDKGIHKYSGLLDVAMQTGHVVKPSMGWYSRVIDGVQEERKYREKDTHTAEFWDVLLNDDDFKQKASNLYMLVKDKIDENNVDEYLDEVDDYDDSDFDNLD